MNGSVFKRKLKSGATVWCYSFYAGRDENGKPINLMKGGFETKGAASTAMRAAIAEYEKSHGKITRHRGVLGTMTWGYTFRDEIKNGFADAGAARTALAEAVARQAASEQATTAEVDAQNRAEKNPIFTDYIRYWLKEHASRSTSPKTFERYGDFAGYLIRHLGETRINDLSTAQIQRVIHRLGDCGGMITKDHPNGRPLAAKTVRHIGTMLYTLLAEARPAWHPDCPASDGEQTREAPEVAEAEPGRSRKGKAQGSPGSRTDHEAVPVHRPGVRDRMQARGVARVAVVRSRRKHERT
jgi:hypothetical protein